MESRIAKALGMENRPVVLTWTDEKPADAVEFTPGRWGCVMSVFAQVAARGRSGVFARDTYGCWGAGVGLGFGNRYEDFPGGVDCFYRFLSDGNAKWERGREMGSRLAGPAGRRFADDFLLGERYLKDPETTRRFVDSMPMRDIPAKYVLAKPLDSVDPTREQIKSVTFFTDPDRISALVVLANYTSPGQENVAIPWAAGCQVMGIFAYREAEREHPRALVGLTDLSARKNVRHSLGRHVMSFTVPWSLFLELEERVENSFLQRETWHALGYTRR
jgi:hypothetical protein